VVALLDTGEATLKRFYREGSKIRLQPANSTMEPRIVDADSCACKAWSSACSAATTI